jgi:hypothetical protein
MQQNGWCDSSSIHPKIQKWTTAKARKFTDAPYMHAENSNVPQTDPKTRKMTISSHLGK